MLPNADPIDYKGDTMINAISKMTEGKVYYFFKKIEKFMLF